MEEHTARTPLEHEPAGRTDFHRRLLGIRVPVTVTLAAKRLPIGDILTLEPGSIVAFDKSCREPLEVSAGGQRLAEGSCVRTGERIALRITSILPPT
jgi:flagellar motor switch protein FliN/FliY